MKAPFPMVFTCEIVARFPRRLTAQCARIMGRIERLHREELKHHARGASCPLMVRYRNWRDGR
jgi:hypothetical protein